MVEKRQSSVDRWLGRETPRVRKALESASKYFDGKYRCTEGHWVTIDDRPVFLCD